MATELIEYKSDSPKYGLIRDGIAGNYEIIGKMIDLVKDSTVLDKGLEDLVKKTLHNNDLDSYSDTDKLFNFIFDWVKYGDASFQGVDYIKDIEGKTESIKDARTTLQDGYGDCDDFAILYATILSVLGYEPCFVIAKYPDENTFQHVYTVTYVNGKRYAFDGTIPDGHLNNEVENMQKQEICVFGDNAYNDPVVSTLRNIKNLVTQTRRNARQAAPQLANFLPVGIIGKTVARNVFSGIQDESFNELVSRLGGEISDLTIKLQNGNITKANALSQARKLYAEIHAQDKSNIDTELFNRLDQKLLNKVLYIANFTPYGIDTATAPATGLSIQDYVVIGVVGLGVWYFYKHANF